MKVNWITCLVWRYYTYTVYSIHYRYYSVLLHITILLLILYTGTTCRILPTQFAGVYDQTN